MGKKKDRYREQERRENTNSAVYILSFRVVEHGSQSKTVSIEYLNMKDGAYHPNEQNIVRLDSGRVVR